MDNVKVGIVGLYGIANRHYDEISSTPELELGAVCDVNEKELPTAKEELGAEMHVGGAVKLVAADPQHQHGTVDALQRGDDLRVHPCAGELLLHRAGARALADDEAPLRRRDR